LVISVLPALLSYPVQFHLRLCDFALLRFIMSSVLDDQTLVQSAQQGNLDAFNILIERYQDLLFRIALRMLGDDSAADAAQVAWLSAFRKLSEFRGGRFKTWLARVVVNTCYDEIRLRHRRREVALVPGGERDLEMDSPFWLADTGPGVEEQVETAEFNRILEKCLQTLTPAYRSMLVLVDIEGFSYEEAAAAESVPLGTVRSRLARARMGLRRQLEGAGGLSPLRPRYPVSSSRQARARCP
jgi:RNA polymerase sigma-70 factor (ECF subfamily)